MEQLPEFHLNFFYKSDSYEADVWNYLQLTIRERLDYSVGYYSYLVLLKGPYDFKPFEIYVDDEAQWRTQSSFVVDDEIVKKIGSLIEDKTM